MSRRSRSQAAAAEANDGKVRVACPQCGTMFRVAEEMLDHKIECSECHRVFLARNTVGKRVAPPNHNKVYAIFGVVAVLMIVSFVMLQRSGAGDGKTPAPAAPAAKPKSTYTRQNHPRAQQVMNWAQAMGNDNRLVIKTHNDLQALAKRLGLPPTDENALFQGVLKNDATKYFRELHIDSATLSDEASMTGPNGRGHVYLSRQPGTDVYAEGATAEYDVVFVMDGEQIKVTDWTLTVQPQKNTRR